MINTYNESDLHKILKNMAARKHNGKTEQKVGSYICDILTEDGTVMEIQTKNFKNIRHKLDDLLQNRRVVLIYPLVCESYIEYYAEDGAPLPRRKSPKKRCMYDIFDELTGIWPVLLHKNFTLEVLETVAVKKRCKTREPVQSANKRRRHKKNWYADGSTLESIGKSRIFCGKDDYLALLPEALPNEFGGKELCAAAVQKINGRQVNKILWTLHKMQLIERIRKEGKRFIYRIKKE